MALFSALEQTHCARMWFYMTEQLFIARFWKSTEAVYLQRWHGWCHKNLLPSRRVLSTPYNHAPCHFMQSHIRKVYACLAVTWHLRFWQNDRDLLRATAVTHHNQHRRRREDRKISNGKGSLGLWHPCYNPGSFSHFDEMTPLPGRRRNGGVFEGKMLRYSSHPNRNWISTLSFINVYLFLLLLLFVALKMGLTSKIRTCFV